MYPYLLSFLFSNLFLICQAQVSSTFDTNDEGWTVEGDATSPIPAYHGSGGNPDGYLTATDAVKADTWYWSAPSKFLGNQVSVCHKKLQFDLKQNATDHQNVPQPDLIISTSTKVIVCSFKPFNNPLTTWTHYEIPLDTSWHWKLNSLNGTDVAESDIESVLSNIISIKIRGEYRTGADIGSLDNAYLTEMSAIQNPVTIQASSLSVLQGTPVTFTATPVNFRSPVIYQWYKNKMPVGNNTSVYTDKALNNNDSVWVTVNGTNICNAVSSSLSNKITLTVINPSCTKTLGDPIVNQDFGAGENPGPPLPAGVTTLQYVNNNCPNDGEYTLTNYSTTCYPTLWHNTTDHTGNPNGYFMVINASYAPSDFFTDTIENLCEGTTYQFSAWAINLITTNDILPDITFTIEDLNGVVLGSYTTGNIPVTTETTWNQYGFYFTTSPGISTVVIRMHNNAPGGFGNDLAIDDITFRPTGPAVSIGFSGISSNTLTVCENSTGNLHLVSSVDACYVSTGYQWQVSKDKGVTWQDIQGANQQDYYFLPPAVGTYLYRLAVAQAGSTGIEMCRVKSGYVTVISNAAQHVKASVSATETDVCKGESITFTATGITESNPSIQWLVNNQPAALGGITYTTDALNNGDVVSCMPVSHLACSISDLSNTIRITVNSLLVPSVNITPIDVNSCSGVPVTFTAASANEGSSPSYQWMINNQLYKTGDNALTVKDLNDKDEIDCILTSSEKCVTTSKANSNVAEVHIFPLPVVDAGRSVSIQYGNDTILHGSVVGDYENIIWTPATGLINYRSLNPVAQPERTTVYTLEVHTGEGCKATDTVTVKVLPKGTFIPSAFTPNGDGTNDIFKAWLSEDATNYSFAIYNRWGQKIFESKQPGEGWNGISNSQYQPAGTYVWILTYKTNDQVIHKKGLVTLIR